MNASRKRVFASDLLLFCCVRSFIRILLMNLWKNAAKSPAPLTSGLLKAWSFPAIVN